MTTEQKRSQVKQRLAEQPIALPDNPFWEVFRDFGRDELIALFLSTMGVGILSKTITNPGMLALVGVLVEKLGFFVHSTKTQIDLYRTTAPEDRNHPWQYAKDAFKKGLPNLAKDLAGHDWMYAGLFWLELQRFPDTPPWMLSIIAFMLSVGAVSTVEVGVKEADYLRKTIELRKKDFSVERHLESRFVVEEDDVEGILEELTKEFDLGEIHTSEYHDEYFTTNLKSYNGRKPNVRVRQRTEMGKEPGEKEIQVIYTRASREKNKAPEQYNYFPVNKDKFKLPLTTQGQAYLDTITVPESKTKKVNFTRQYAHIPEKMLISTDTVKNGPDSYTVIEVKSFRNDNDAVNHMIMAMRHVMSRYNVVQTTHSKQNLTSREK